MDTVVRYRIPSAQQEVGWPDEEREGCEAEGDVAGGRGGARRLRALIRRAKRPPHAGAARRQRGVGSVAIAFQLTSRYGTRARSRC